VGPAPTALLEGLTGLSPLPPAALAPLDWPAQRAPIARVQTLRTMLAPGEPLRVRAYVLAPLAAIDPLLVPPGPGATGTPSPGPDSATRLAARLPRLREAAPEQLAGRAGWPE
jgi:hypothetical protein